LEKKERKKKKMGNIETSRFTIFVPGHNHGWGAKSQQQTVVDKKMDALHKGIRNAYSYTGNQTSVGNNSEDNERILKMSFECEQRQKFWDTSIARVKQLISLYKFELTPEYDIKHAKAVAEQLSLRSSYTFYAYYNALKTLVEIELPGSPASIGMMRTHFTRIIDELEKYRALCVWKQIDHVRFGYETPCVQFIRQKLLLLLALDASYENKYLSAAQSHRMANLWNSTYCGALNLRKYVMEMKDVSSKTTPTYVTIVQFLEKHHITYTTTDDVIVFKDDNGNDITEGHDQLQFATVLDIISHFMHFCTQDTIQISTLELNMIDALKDALIKLVSNFQRTFSLNGADQTTLWSGFQMDSAPDQVFILTNMDISYRLLHTFNTFVSSKARITDSRTIHSGLCC